MKEIDGVDEIASNHQLLKHLVKYGIWVLFQHIMPYTKINSECTKDLDIRL